MPLLVALAALALFALSRTMWRPNAPLRLLRHGSWGQTLAAAAACISGVGPFSSASVWRSLPSLLRSRRCGPGDGFVALTTAYVYFDALVHERLEPRAEADVLPAEIDARLRSSP